MFGSDSSAEKSARVAKQLRDKNGRWIEMGGLVKWTGLDGIPSAGKVVGTNEDDTATIKVTSEVGKDSTVNVPSSKLTAVNEKADLDIPTTETVPEPVKPEPAASMPEDDPDHGFRGKITSPYTVKDSAFKNFPGYTMEQELVLQRYAYDFQGINQPLRRIDGSEDSKRNMPSYHTLMSVLDKSVLAEPITVYRGLFADKDVLAKLQKNNVYFDKAFTSTSSKETVASDRINTSGQGAGPKDKTPVTLQINLPTGFKAHKFDYTMNNSNRIERFANEEEVLLPPEVAFRVISMEKNQDGIGYHAVVEPILTSQNSVGVPVDDAAAKTLIDTPVKKKKWGLFSLSASELSVGSTLVANNGIVITKITDELWEYTSAANKISYNNNSIDNFKLINSIDFDVEF